ncbi:MAG TPA: hypothetical protein PLA12_14475, partial [Candidatus Hydrogenedens sp.]|nr:hypothetical protein [Candidatus Hydrogenedens sp.]
MLIRNKANSHIVIIFFLLGIGILSGFTCFSAEGTQFQTSFTIQRGAILINSNKNYFPSFYLLDTGVSIPILERKDEADKEEYQKYNNVILKDLDY